MRRSPLPSFNLRGRSLLPIVQGGMGVGVSAHRLAGSVAALGAVGTIASVDLRRLHPDLMEATGRSRSREEIEEANLTALEREIGMAREIAQGRGAIAVNVMRAVSQYVDYVSTAGRAGADAVVMGAGLPLDLPDIAADFPNLALMPILSDARGVSLLLKKWMRKNRLPDAIVIEHPGHAGGHLGAAKVEDLHDTRFDFENVLEATFGLFRELGLAAERIPLIVAGGIATPQRVRELLGLGASAVQLGTAFAVTEEGDAHPTFKKVLAEAKPEDIVEFVSVAGLPARAVKTPWLAKYLDKIPVMERRRKPRTQCTLAFDCLQACGLRDGLARFGQFCIDLHLAAALEGNLDRGLFFRGGGRLPFGDRIRPVRELLDYLLAKPEPQPA